jgi:hypothetical protein
MTAGLKTIIALSFVCGSRQPSVLCSFTTAFFHSYTLLVLSLTRLVHQVLAVGFLLVILSCALWNKYYPLLVVATYVLAPIPNWVCGRCANPDDFASESGGNAIIDFGKFVTGFLVTMGIGQSSAFPLISTWLKLHGWPPYRPTSLEWIHMPYAELRDRKLDANSLIAALPVILAHSHIIAIPAMIMCIIGGLLIYGTIISFSMFFQEEQEF